jgi:hypothetical protein
VSHHPFTVLDLQSLVPEEHRGATGTSFWKAAQLDGLRVRLVEYSAGYLADHWCEKGHIVYCIEGSFETRLQDGSSWVLSKGMCYVVSDGLSSHQSFSKDGVTLLIIDGDFLAGNTDALNKT